MKAIWNQVTLADSDNTIVVDNNHYFPMNSLDKGYFLESDKTSRCFWKGIASYFTIVVDGEMNTDAAWYYPKPKDRAANIKNYVAFWQGVQVIE